MNKQYLFGVLFLLIIIIQGVSATPFNISYTYVNTDSETEYLNLQYGNYYDNVNLRLRLQATDGYSSVPVIVSPKVYGISDNGQLTYLYSVPTETYYAYSTPYDYTYSNLFYLNPNYQGYVVKVYAEATNYYYNTYSYAYVYPVNTSPYYYFIDEEPTTPQEPVVDTPDCSDFYLSGVTDIYLDEDEEKTYNLYIENETDSTLEVLDVETSNPSELDIDDIDYPDTVPGLSVRTIRVYVQADSVSDDYDSSFDITVSAKYANTQTCTKTYHVEYHIDEDGGSSDNGDASCSDLILRNLNFTINDNDVTTRKITLENNSEDYDFDIDDITINDRDGLDTSITDEPSEVASDDSEYIELELETDDFDYTITKYLDLEVTGNFNDDDDKECTKRANVTVTIENDGDNDNDYYDPVSSCRNISLYAMNISQAENTTKRYTRDDGFYFVNNSNSNFTITNLSVNDNTSYANVTNTSYTQTTSPRNTGSINFDLTTSKVSSEQDSRATLSISGRFADGKTCSYSDIGTKYFDISVYESTNDSCSGIKVNSKQVTSGNNTVTISNNTNKKFYVNDVLFQNRNGINANVNNTQATVLANNNTTMNVGISGTGTVEMQVSGRFEDGKQCSFLQTTSGILSTSTTNGTANLSGDCDFEINAPTATFLNNSQETISATFRNLTTRNGRIEITGNGLTIDPSVIFLSGNDNFTQNITLTNYDYPTGVYYFVYLNGCPVKTSFTNIINNISTEDRISLVSYPTVISPVTNNVVVMVTVNNSFTINKEVTLKLSGFPESFTTTSKTLTLSAHDTKTESLNLLIPENANRISYNGYIELYTSNTLVNKYPITINLSSATSAITVNARAEKVFSQDRTYNLTLTLKNNTSIPQNVIIDFGLPETYVIEGDKDVSILPGEEITKKYKVVSPTLLREDKVLDIKIIDKTTGQEIATQKLSLEAGRSPLSGFFTFANAGWVILGLVILVVLFVIFKRK